MDLWEVEYTRVIDRHIQVHSMTVLWSIRFYMIVLGVFQTPRKHLSVDQKATTPADGQSHTLSHLANSSLNTDDAFLKCFQTIVRYHERKCLVREVRYC